MGGVRFVSDRAAALFFMSNTFSSGKVIPEVPI
jgi:hypothetical protein